MLTLQNIDLRWILATIVESGNCRFWGWHELFFVTFFWLLFFLRTWNQSFFFAYMRENSPVQPLSMVFMVFIVSMVSMVSMVFMLFIVSWPSRTALS